MTATVLGSLSRLRLTGQVARTLIWSPTAAAPCRAKSALRGPALVTAHFDMHSPVLRVQLLKGEGNFSANSHNGEDVLVSGWQIRDLKWHQAMVEPIGV